MSAPSKSRAEPDGPSRHGACEQQQTPRRLSREFVQALGFNKRESRNSKGLVARIDSEDGR